MRDPGNEVVIFVFCKFLEDVKFLEILPKSVLEAKFQDFRFSEPAQRFSVF